MQPLIRPLAKKKPGSSATKIAPPSLQWERCFWRDGLVTVAGVDEVGRGALAGPLVSAAVVFPHAEGTKLRTLRALLRGVCDSKRLDPISRLLLASRIEHAASAVSIGAVPSWELDRIGLAAANRLSMERAVWGLHIAPDAILLDACTIDYDAPQVGLVHGDALSLSIAAASIVAKVTRDAIMDDLDEIAGAYGFAAHKGYGTHHHLVSLQRHGPSPFHRRSFAPVAALT